MASGPDYSPIAEAYSTYRPSYPQALFRWLASIANRHDLAWDTATGNGQAAVGLAAHFRKVIATDLSQEQLRHARGHTRVEYRVALAEDSGLQAGTVDLVVAAAALHWFDLPRFCQEVRRVTRRGGVLAAWSYHVAHAEGPIGGILLPLYQDVVAPYFAPGARMVDDRYATIDLPGEEIICPVFHASATWTAAQVVGFIRTWSGVQTYINETGTDPVERLEPVIADLYGSPEAVQDVRWPLYLRASRL